MKRSILSLLLLLAPAALLAGDRHTLPVGNLGTDPLEATEVYPDDPPASIWFSVENPTDPMIGTHELPWEIHRHDGISFSTSPVLSLPGQPPISAAHRMNATGAWLLSLSLPTQDPLPPGFVEPRDVLRYDPGIGYTPFFCGASAAPPLPPNADVDAVFLDGGDAGDLILSVDVPVQIDPSTWALPADLLRYTRTGAGCGGWSYAGKAFGSGSAGGGVPASANISGASSFGGALLFVVDSPTSLTPSASTPPIYDERDLVSWDGASFDRVYAEGANPFLNAMPPSAALTSLTTVESAAATAAPPGSDVLIVGDPDFDTLSMVVVTDISSGTATSKVTPVWPPPWLPADVARIKGPLAVRSDYSRVYIMMDGEYHIRGVNPVTGAVVDSFTSAIHGSGVDLDLDGADTTIYSTTTLGEVVAVDVTPGGTFGTMTTVAAGLMTPMGIDVDAAGTYAYVAEHGAGRIVRVELATGVVTPVATLASPPRDVAIVDGIFLLASITDAGDLSLVDGDPMSPGFGTATSVLSGLSDPTSVNIGSSGLDGVIVTDGGTGELLSVDADSASPDFGTAVRLASGPGAPGGAGLILLPGFVMLPCFASPPTGSTIATCAYAATGATELGSYGATLSWDPAELSFAGWGAGEPPFDTPVVNTANVASGMLSFSDAAASGAAGTNHLLCVQFDVIGPRTAPGQTMPLDLTMTSAFDTGLGSLVGGAVVADHPLDITAACDIGDPVADGTTNSGDALGVLRREVGLSLPMSVETLMQARCGDLNADRRTDSTDANIALTYEVGLPVDPTFPIGLSNVISDSCGGGVCAGQPALLAGTSTEGIASAASGPVVASLRVEAGRIRPGDTFDVIVEVEAGVHTLGSLAAALSWDTEAAGLVGIGIPEDGPLGAPTVNDAEAASGKLRFAAASPLGAVGSVELIRLTLTARHALPKPERVFTLEFSSMAATGPRFESLLPVLEFAAPVDRRGRP